LGTVRCGGCGADNPEPEGGAPFFCRQCHEVVDPGGKLRAPPAPTVPSKSSGEGGKPSFVSQYSSQDPTYRGGPGAGFSVGGNKVLGYVLAAVAAAGAAAGLGWLALHVAHVPVLPALVAGWVIKRALAAGSGGGTPDRGPLGVIVLLAIVFGTFATWRYVGYLAASRDKSPRYEEMFGPDLGDLRSAIETARSRDPDRDGFGTLSDETTYRIDEEEQRLRAALATGEKPKDGYDVVLLAGTGHSGLAGHVRHAILSGIDWRPTPGARPIPVEGWIVAIWWLVEAVVLVLAAFSRVE
jgi:hypothetical protein